MGDLTDDELAHLDWCSTAGSAWRRATAEIRRYRAMIKRLEAWAALLESDTFATGGIGVGPFIAAELRNRMKGDGNG